MNHQTATPAPDILNEIDAFRGVIAELTDRSWPTATVLAQTEAVDGLDDTQLWSDLVATGAPVVALAEDLGGLGAGPVGAVAVIAQAAAGLQPGGLLVSNGFVAPILNALVATHAEPEARVLGERLAAGSRAAVVHMGDREDTDGDVLHIQAKTVLEADRADFLIVVAGRGSRTAILAVEDLSNLTITRVSSYDPTRRYADMAGAISVPAATVLARGLDAAAAVREADLSALISVAADAAGGAREITRNTVAYACTREQFGKPIGSFQALRHLIVDTHVKVEQAAAATVLAARAIASDALDSALYSHVSKALACDAYTTAAATGVQVHGGIGFTREVTAHLHVKRALADNHLLGTASAHRARIADLLALGIPDEW